MTTGYVPLCVASVFFCCCADVAWPAGGGVGLCLPTFLSLVAVLFREDEVEFFVPGNQVLKQTANNYAQQKTLFKSLENIEGTIVSAIWCLNTNALEAFDSSESMSQVYPEKYQLLTLAVKRKGIVKKKQPLIISAIKSRTRWGVSILVNSLKYIPSSFPPTSCIGWQCYLPVFK